jgi:hypothetical protein
MTQREPIRKKQNSPHTTYTLDLNIRPQRQLPNSHTRPRRLHSPPISLVNLIHLSKILHIRKENIDFEDVLEARTGGLEDGGEVGDALVLDGGKLLA